MDKMKTEFELLQCSGTLSRSSSSAEDTSVVQDPSLKEFHLGNFHSVIQQECYRKLTDTTVSLEAKRREVDSLLQKAVDLDDPSQCCSLLYLGVASLLTYVQHNITGPEVKDESVEGWMRKELEIDGEDFMAKTCRLDLLLMARIVLMEPLSLLSVSGANDNSGNDACSALQIGDLTVEVEVKDKCRDVFRFVSEHVPSWLWWAGRVSFVHQRFLKHSSATLRMECITLADALSDRLPTWKELPDDYAAQCYLELAQWEFLYRRSQSATDYIDKAATILGVSIELSGALGKRTVYQMDPKAQLIAHIQRSAETQIEKPTEEKEQDAPMDRTALEEGYQEDDVLMRPQWNEHVSLQPLTLVEQCLALAKCDSIELGTANDELRSWQMEPFAQLIQSQQQSAVIIQTRAKLLRVLHERDRGRTRERALSTMEDLVDNIRHGSGNSRGRLLCVFAVRMPGIIQLRKQLAEHHISFGVVAEAIATYEELELWDELVLCYRLLEKKAIADQIVTRQLESDPENPSLLCTLADLRSDPELYSKAWKASQCKYPRAQRSLARHNLEKKQYKAAAEAFELALNLNTLHPDAWFSLGYCYLKLSDDDNALRAFTWCSQLDPDNGESWNNLAALWMRRHKPDRALWALKEAVKLKHNSWETWENYAKASQECGEYFLAIHGMGRVLELTDGQRLQADLFTSLIQSFLRLSEEPTDKIDVKKLGAKLEVFLRKASVGSGWIPEHWTLFAKVQRCLNQPQIGRECLMKSFRQLQGSTWKSESSQFKVLVSVLSEIVEHYKDFGCSKGDAASLCLQLRGIVKQAERVYSESDDLQKLHHVQNVAMEYERTL